ncbi:oligosaccharide flippase family protein [Sphingobacterium athyrii]|uniref:Polysaccharide biosynthesis protein n=1 Tax=Sphingobacterium athyrii TaxID=2152717 RepID=A0A363NQA3_9SPHI|nr:oligosaccharide flippase family protein [Sphingobacterium athyrii]PUV22948.1 hypothetical protein DCO56_18680 [Sphingobacterium athyrii]
MELEAKQVRKNLIFNVLSLLANIAVGLFYTPYLVKNLGISAYGIVPLALIINQYVNVVTGSLTSALSRFYSIALRQNKSDEASKYLSTSIVIFIGLILALILPLWYFVQNIEFIFNIPSDLLEDSKSLFLLTILSLFFSLFSSIFNITLYAFNRLDLLNIVKIIRISGKLIFVLFLFTSLEVNVKYVGAANLITEIILLIYSITVFYRFSEGKVVLGIRHFNKAALIAVGGMAFWVIVQQMGDMGLYRIDNILVNKFWSTNESGVLGAFEELGNYTITIAMVISSLFGPLILIAYANEDTEQVKKLTIDRSLSVGVLVAVMIGILGGFSPIILKAWLGEGFAEYNTWLMIKLTLTPFYISAGVFAYGSRAMNKVRFPALMTIFLGLINALILYGLGYYAHGNIDIVNWMLVVGLIMGVLQSYFLNGLYFAKFYKGTARKVMLNALRIGGTICAIYLIGYLITPLLIGMHIIPCLILIAVIALILLIIALKINLKKSQINELIHLVYKK